MINFPIVKTAANTNRHAGGKRRFKRSYVLGRQPKSREAPCVGDVRMVTVLHSLRNARRDSRTVFWVLNSWN